MNPTPNTETPEPKTPEAPAPEAAQDGTAEDRTPATTTVEDGPAGAEVKADQAGTTDLEKTGTTDVEAEDGVTEVLGDDEDDDLEPYERRSSGLAAASAAVVAVALGIVALTGSWTGTIGAAREQLVGQITTPQGATIAKQITEGYSDGWHVTAAINGFIALLALIIAVVALLLPQRASWVRPFAVAAVVLGAIGVIVSLGMYFDLFASIPSAPTPAAPPAAPPAG
ncbi:efflux RND transporter permease subunit [Streptomyces sp. 150FB]|uniref:efflux RND transporter permease subunit n=1 Tax=Streptomyces sp. 150FB TaxID=1576605 RepID=UPI00069614B9|nr:efflux RND transporter permease subunit [Streptomyces sp. 150FB]